MYCKIDQADQSTIHNLTERRERESAIKEVSVLRKLSTSGGNL